jgi:3-deoxy-D-manno-octulosonate 8-phosphate phosphatase (KDO 8-P phosphatase)
MTALCLLSPNHWSRGSLLREGCGLARASERISSAVQQRARKIRLLLMDVDGVLTDGRIRLQSLPDGSALEMKVFSAYDGAGLKMARAVGLRTGLITGRDSPATARRAQEVGMEFVFQDRGQKLGAYEEILAESGLRDAKVAYVGDDLPDLPVLTRVGLAIAVANAAPEVKRAAHYVTRRSGGDGAVREVVELLLKAQGKWPQAVELARA